MCRPVRTSTSLPGSVPIAQAIASEYPTTNAWANATVDRLRSWGFNTIGPFSDSSTFAPLMPYTVQLTMASGPDWFAPSFVTHADQVAAIQVAPLADDPNLIGYFTDNELNWGPNEDNSQSLLNQYLELPAGSPGLAVAEQYPNDPNGFVTALATRYFSVTSDAIHMYDTNHLNLGVKAESNDIPPELLQVASHYVDAFSIDDYQLQPGDAAAAVKAFPHYLPIEPNFANFETLVHKPIVIAEYSFRATGPTPRIRCRTFWPPSPPSRREPPPTATTSEPCTRVPRGSLGTIGSNTSTSPRAGGSTGRTAISGWCQSATCPARRWCRPRRCSTRPRRTRRLRQDLSVIRGLPPSVGRRVRPLRRPSASPSPSSPVRSPPRMCSCRTPPR